MGRELDRLVTRWVDEAVASARGRGEPCTTIHVLDVALRPRLGAEGPTRRWSGEATRLLGSPAGGRPLRDLLAEVRAAPRAGPITASELLDTMASGMDATMLLLARAGYETWTFGEPPASWDLASAALRVASWEESADDLGDMMEPLIAAARQAGPHAPHVVRLKTPDAATAARVLWVGFTTGRLLPVSLPFWKAMAVPGAYDTGDLRRLLTFLQTEWADFAQPAPGVPAGWRSGIEFLIRGLPSSDELERWAAELPSPWREGLAYGLEAAVRNASELAQCIGDEEPDWNGLLHRVNAGLEPPQAVAAALAARGWHRVDVPVGVPALPWEPPGGRPIIEVPRSAPADPAAPIEVDTELIERAIPTLSDPFAGCELVGPPDYQAVALRCGGWCHEVDDHGIRIELVDLPGPAGVALGRGPERARIEVEHRGGRAAVWVTGGRLDPEHGLEPRLLARDFVSFVASSGAVSRWAPSPVPAAEVDPRGDQALERWLAGLPPFTRVVDLRDVPTPVLVPEAALEASGSRNTARICRCGEVVLAVLPSAEEVLLLGTLADEGTVDGAARRLGLHPLALRWQLDRLRPALRP